jgi:hypothetical protein
MQTLRSGGNSEGKYNSFNLATHVNDEINAVHLNRDLLNQYLTISPYWLHQTHSVDVLELPSPTLNGDASYTIDKNTVCVVQTADCLPLLVTNIDGTIVAAIHAGWRGLLDGVIEKYVPGDYEFDVPQKLIDLYNAKDYGKYADNGKMPVAFIATNHTTGGNSGSPALDANGNLIGLNFDRVWEGTMSDVYYSPDICRNIMVDIRFVLFIIDKYAGATNLIEELKLVHPKK